METAYTFLCCALTAAVSSAFTTLALLPSLLRGRQAEHDLQRMQMIHAADRMYWRSVVVRMNEALVGLAKAIADASRGAAEVAAEDRRSHQDPMRAPT